MEMEGCYSGYNETSGSGSSEGERESELSGGVDLASPSRGPRQEEERTRQVACGLLVPPPVGPWVTHRSPYGLFGFAGFGSLNAAPHRLLPIPDPNVAPSSLWHLSARPTSRPTSSTCFGRRVKCFVYSWKPCSGRSLLRSPSQHGLEAIRRRAGSRRRPGPRRPPARGSVASGPRWSLTTACQRLDNLFLLATTTSSRPTAHQHTLHDLSPL